MFDISFMLGTDAMQPVRRRASRAPAPWSLGEQLLDPLNTMDCRIFYGMGGVVC